MRSCPEVSERVFGGLPKSQKQPTRFAFGLARALREVLKRWEYICRLESLSGREQDSHQPWCPRADPLEA
jgi:hypothetical protein